MIDSELENRPSEGSILFANSKQATPDLCPLAITPQATDVVNRVHLIFMVPDGAWWLS